MYSTEDVLEEIFQEVNCHVDISINPHCISLWCKSQTDPTNGLGVCNVHCGRVQIQFLAR